MRISEEQYRDYLRRHGSNPPAPSGPKPPPPPNPPARQSVQRHRPGEMNKTEAAYALVLEGLLHAHEIAGYGFERIKLRLADRTFYTPDFDVMRLDGRLEFHEVKGVWRDDARVKIKVAAAQYPFRFIAVSKRKKRDGGGWHTETFG
jgi:hypothetical protein